MWNISFNYVKNCSMLPLMITFNHVNIWSILSKGKHNRIFKFKALSLSSVFYFIISSLSVFVMFNLIRIVIFMPEIRTKRNDVMRLQKLH